MRTRVDIKGKTLYVNIMQREFRKDPRSHLPTALMLFIGREEAQKYPDRDAFTRVTVRVIGVPKKGNLLKQKVVNRRTFDWVNDTLRSMPKKSKRYQKVGEAWMKKRK